MPGRNNRHRRNERHLPADNQRGPENLAKETASIITTAAASAGGKKEGNAGRSLRQKKSWPDTVRLVRFDRTSPAKLFRYSPMSNTINNASSITARGNRRRNFARYPLGLRYYIDLVIHLYVRVQTLFASFGNKLNTMVLLVAVTFRSKRTSNFSLFPTNY